MKITYRKANKLSTKAKIGQCNYIDQDNSKEFKKKNVATQYIIRVLDMKNTETHSPS